MALPGASSSKPIFREYIGAMWNGVQFSDVPINSSAVFHFILSFAVDVKKASPSSPAIPTDGKFEVYWDTDNFSPDAVRDFKAAHKNVKVALSLGGDRVGDDNVSFQQPSSINSWVANAVSSLTEIITQYGLDGIDINYERFETNSDTFARCIGRLLETLKNRKVISFASIAPFEEDVVQAPYQALWNMYGSRLINYVNFQFYGYPRDTTVEQFLEYFNTQLQNYPGGNLLASFISDGSMGLMPEDGFFDACATLRQQRKLAGIFIWCADDSKKLDFRYENQTLEFLAGQH